MNYLIIILFSLGTIIVPIYWLTGKTTVGIIGYCVLSIAFLLSNVTKTKPIKKKQKESIETRKLIVGLILFATGIILQGVSHMNGIWVFCFFGSVLWPVGTAIGINALIALKCKKQKTEDGSPS